MNVDNTLKSLIPPSILEGIPSERRVHVADRIIQFFKEQNQTLYDQMARLGELTDEMTADCTEKIRAAALAAHNHYFNKAR